MDGMDMQSVSKTGVDDSTEVEELKEQVDELRKLVHTLLNVICEEPDGVHSGAAPVPADAPRIGLCM